jgi:hypothetical protein
VLPHLRTDAGRHWSSAAARPTSAALRPRRACADGSLRTNSDTPTRSRWHGEDIPLIVIQRQLGHSNLGISSIYLQGIDSAEIIETVHARRAPVIPVSASLRLSTTAEPRPFVAQSDTYSDGQSPVRP